MERVSRLTILGGGLSISSSSNELIGDALTLPNILFSLSLCWWGVRLIEGEEEESEDWNVYIDFWTFGFIHSRAKLDLKCYFGREP